MEPVPYNVLKRANEAAVYNLYLYLTHIKIPGENTPLWAIVHDLEAHFKKHRASTRNSRDITRLDIISRVVSDDLAIANSRIGNLTVSKSGLTACTFVNPDGEVFFAFKGTGKGEWIDNGEGLSGIAEENTYKFYDAASNEPYTETVKQDHATDQQVEALNFFCETVKRNGWGGDNEITVSGHSKGGNKAQFVAVNSGLVTDCYSFNGQGFSPEALAHFKARFGADFDSRRQKIYSFSSHNDYINVLGERLMPKENICFFESQFDFHYLESMLDDSGKFNPQSEQGRLSKYVESLSDRLMQIRPSVRKYATLGIMNIFQKFLGDGIPVNGDDVSVEQTVTGLAVTADLLLRQFYGE